MAANHKRMHKIKEAFARSENEVVALIAIADSRGDWRKWRFFGHVTRCFNVKWAGLIVEGGVQSNNGSEDGLGNFPLTLTGISNTIALAGETLANSGFVNRYPGVIQEWWVTGATSNPHFSRFNIVYSTAGFDMHSNAAGATGGQFYRGDPAQGRNVTSIESFFITDNRAGIWLGGGQSFGFSASESSGGSTTFSPPPSGASDGTITQFVFTPTQATGTNIRVRQYHTDAAPATGRGHILAATRINFGTSGILFTEWNVGGYSTTDHLAQNPPDSVNTNTDWKYLDSKATEYYQKIVRATVAIVRIDLGQNQSSITGYAEWNGTDIGTYKRNIQWIMDRMVSILQAAGVTSLYFQLSAPWRGSGDTFARLDQCRTALSQLADEYVVSGIVKSVSFYDQQGAIEDAGFTTSNELSTTYRQDTAHQNFAGMATALGPTEWAAIASAASPAKSLVSSACGVGVGLMG